MAQLMAVRMALEDLLTPIGNLPDNLHPIHHEENVTLKFSSVGLFAVPNARIGQAFNLHWFSKGRTRSIEKTVDEGEIRPASFWGENFGTGFEELVHLIIRTEVANTAKRENQEIDSIPILLEGRQFCNAIADPKTQVTGEM